MKGFRFVASNTEKTIDKFDSDKIAIVKQGSIATTNSIY